MDILHQLLERAAEQIQECPDCGDAAKNYPLERLCYGYALKYCEIEGLIIVMYRSLPSMRKTLQFVLLLNVCIICSKCTEILNTGRLFVTRLLYFNLNITHTKKKKRQVLLLSPVCEDIHEIFSKLTF